MAPARAETLDQALASAYNNNPSLRGEQARLRATDESLAIAQSGYRPTVSSQFTFTHEVTKTHPPGQGDGTTDPRNQTITATEHLFDGFQTSNSVKEADANIRAERENLRAIEVQVLLNAVTAYMDVVRDKQILSARDQNVTALAEELRSVKARFDVGEVTRTDVEQARASLAAAQSAEALAKANLRNSSARFLLYVGNPPSRLVEPREPVRMLPPSVDEAIAAAEASRPTVVQAAFLEAAMRSQIRVLTGQLLPQVTLTGEITRTDDPSRFVDTTTTSSITTQVTVPIYESGSVRAEIRQAKEQRQGLLENVEQAREQAQSDASSAWSLLQASKAQLVADTVQVESATVALQGVRAELQVGQRTELDVLNAVQTLLLAQVAVVSDKHDVIVNSYTVLATMGRLTADQLRLQTQLYDVEPHYNDTNGKWLDVRVNREEGYAGYDVGQSQK